MAISYTLARQTDLATGKMWTCSQCGSVVLDSALHTAYHAVGQDGRTRGPNG